MSQPKQVLRTLALLFLLFAASIRPLPAQNIQITIHPDKKEFRELLPEISRQTGVEFSYNLEILNITDMRFNSGLKEIKGRRAIRIWFHNFTACIMYRRHFVYKRNHITQEFHQTTHTHIFTCTNTEYREHAT